MRIKIIATKTKPTNIPYNYQYVLHAAIYDLIRKSSKEYSKFLHDVGFVEGERHIKLFTFSKLFFHSYKITPKGFNFVNQFTFYFSTPIPKSFETFVLGIFSDQKITLNFGEKENVFLIKNVEVLPDIDFHNTMKMKCLSPIVISTNNSEEFTGKQHFLDYMRPKERILFIENMKNNLLTKYRLVHNCKFEGSQDFEFGFDPNYIVKRNGRISKLITFKNNIKIIAMEAPFTIKADTELIKIGYECGFGEKNSAGFGMVEKVGNINI